MQIDTAVFFLCFPLMTPWHDVSPVLCTNETAVRTLSEGWVTVFLFEEESNGESRGNLQRLEARLENMSYVTKLNKFLLYSLKK